MEELLRVGAEEVSKELWEKVDVHISLEGWPCAAAVVGLGLMYVIVTKIKFDCQSPPKIHPVSTQSPPKIPLLFDFEV